ncbi:STAS domain-containing protein [Umezawaea beigongshangensis]|uniref:STAS domain-containing protein n=1 Tax=Umezawaea beigongshangensis TaxID=2780383 RepID=UPI0018F22560|nr:STAS domain-containing protein [Umezawaea beigongshangensis]
MRGVPALSTSRASEPPPGLRVRHGRHGRAVVVGLAGEIDLHSTPTLVRALAEALDRARPPAPVVVDMAGVGFLACCGAAGLVRAHHRALALGTELRLAAVTPEVGRALEVLGADRRLLLRRSVAVALAAPGTTGER